MRLAASMRSERMRRPCALNGPVVLLVIRRLSVPVCMRITFFHLRCSLRKVVVVRVTQ